MADTVSKAKRSEIMSKIRSRGNQRTELAHLMIMRDFFEKHSDPDDEVTDPPVIFFSRSRSFTIALNG